MLKSTHICTYLGSQGQNTGPCPQQQDTKSQRPLFQLIHPMIILQEYSTYKTTLEDTDNKNEHFLDLS